MFDRRRYLGTFAVFSLVLLRLVIGWHFFREGTQKVEYDRHDGQLRLAFTAEGFLNLAKGPLAKWYHAQVPDNHGWRDLLATPRRNVPPTEEQPAHHNWATRIADDWRATWDKFELVPGLTAEQKQQTDAAFEARQQQLADYLASQAEAIADYRHELWRLENWRNSPEAGEVPFVDERIATKAAETSGLPGLWVREIRAMEAAYYDDLREVLTDDQSDQASAADAIDDALADSRQKRLNTVNLAVTVLTIAVGVCLLLGLFTRLAAFAGALFLLGVIASQPPWLYDAAPTMPNVIEFAALLVLAGTAAGRWLGLDFFIYALFNRFRHRSPAT